MVYRERLACFLVPSLPFIACFSSFSFSFCFVSAENCSFKSMWIVSTLLGCSCCYCHVPSAIARDLFSFALSLAFDDATFVICADAGYGAFYGNDILYGLTELIRKQTVYVAALQRLSGKRYSTMRRHYFRRRKKSIHGWGVYVNSTKASLEKLVRLTQIQMTRAVAVEEQDNNKWHLLLLSYFGSNATSLYKHFSSERHP